MFCNLLYGTSLTKAHSLLLQLTGEVSFPLGIENSWEEEVITVRSHVSIMLSPPSSSARFPANLNDSGNYWNLIQTIVCNENWHSPMEELGCGTTIFLPVIQIPLHWLKGLDVGSSSAWTAMWESRVHRQIMSKYRCPHVLYFEKAALVPQPKLLGSACYAEQERKTWLSALLEISNHLNKQLLHRTMITLKYILSSPSQKYK